MTFKVIQARYWKWHKSIGYFLLVVCSNNVSILHHFLDTTTFTVYVTVCKLENCFIFGKSCY